jgi:hypothetical protein
LCWLIVVRLLRLLCLLRRNVVYPSWCLGQRYIAGEILKHVDTLGGLGRRRLAVFIRRGETAGACGGVCRVHTPEGRGGGYEKARGSWRGRGEGLLNARGFEKAEVDGVEGEYVITYGRYGTDNKALDYAVARADAPGGRGAYAERFSALSTLTSCVFLVPGGRLI